MYEENRAATVREAVGNFLAANIKDGAPGKHLFEWWHADLETQVQVTNSEDTTDFGAYTQDGDTWWHIRWPKNGKTEPTWTDRAQTFLLEKHAEFIGTSGWNWVQRKSEFVCFDFDSRENHADGLSDDELAFLIERGSACEYVDVVHSTSGKGIHYYVRFDPESLPPAENRIEHKTISYYVLSKLKRDIGERLLANLDVLGNIFWIWAKRTNEKSYAHVSPATRLLRFDKDFSDNWKEDAEAIQIPYSPKRVKTSYYGASQVTDKHKEILDKLANCGYSFSYDDSERRATTHTKALKKLSEELKDFVGAFETKSEGTDTKQNCFMFPVDDGGFTVFRFGNVKEAFPWRESQNGNSYCLYNSPLDPIDTFLHFQMEHEPKQGKRKERFCAETYESFQQAMEFLGCEFTFSEHLQSLIERYYIELTPTTTDSLKIGIDLQKSYEVLLKDMKLKESGRNHFKSPPMIFKNNRFGTYRDTKKEREKQLKTDQIAEFEGLEHLARHTKQQAIFGAAADQEGRWWVGTNVPGEGHKFCLVKSEGAIKDVLQSEYPDLPQNASKAVCGELRRNPWIITCIPFAPEYGQERHWNMNAPKFAFTPSPLDECEQAHHPTWDAILKHCGQELDTALPLQPWCDRWGLKTGKDYLTAWIACMLFEPDQKLPYLFLHGNQDTGKSSLQEAVRTLMIRGDEEGSRALTNTSAFNGELDGKVFIYIEEIDLSRTKSGANVAYERIKDWAVSPTLSIRHLYRAPYIARNYLHFIQVANKISSCPLDQDDTRITALLVPPLQVSVIPRDVRNKRLEEEGPDFMVTLKRAYRRLPSMEGRLRIPVVKTNSKEQVIDATSNELITFIREKCVERATKYIALDVFRARFLQQSSSDVHEGSWGVNKVKTELLNNHYVIEGSGNSATIRGLEFIDA